MAERKAFILFFIAVLVIEAVLMSSLRLLDASSEATALGVGVLLGGAGLGIGFLGVHYH
jgi:hypothetical protein